jgi:hypothetical protein
MTAEPIRPTLSLEDLERWEEHGATWHALDVSDERAVVQLCTCYGEPVDLVSGDSPELIEYVRSRRDD